MSRQTDAKTAQGYREKLDTCSKCAHFKCDLMEKAYEAWNGRQVWTEEKNLRCEIGKFKVRKTAVCDLFEKKEDEDEQQ